MKKIDFENVINNVSDKYVEEAASFVPKRKAGLRWVALAACIAIIVTSVPFAFILNKEDDAEHKHETDHTEQGDITDIPKSFGDIVLENGSLKLNTIMLSHGIINKESTLSQKYVYDYTPIDEESELLKMVTKAMPYHGLTNPEITIDNINRTVLGNASYHLSQSKESVGKSVRANADHTNGTILYSISELIDSAANIAGFEPSTIKFPTENENGKIYQTDEIFTIFKNQIDVYNKLLDKNFDSCFTFNGGPPSSYYSTHVFMWDSRDTEINNTIIEILKKNEGKPLDEWREEYQLISSLALRVDFNCDSNNYVREISLWGDINDPYSLNHENAVIEKMMFLSPKLDKYYFCGSTDEEVVQIAYGLEQYLLDVFGITGLTDSYTVTYKNYQDLDWGSSHYHSFDIAAQKTVVIDLKPTADHEHDTVRITFYTFDNENYCLASLATSYSLGGDRYLELIDADTAIEKLADNKAIGDAGQGCYICREKLRNEVIEYIKNNMTWELVTLDGVVFEMSNGTIVSDLPFYEFTSKPDEDGNTYVAYVIATTGYINEYEKINSSTLDFMIRAQSLAQCPNCLIHDSIEAKKTQRVNAMIEEYVNSFPEEEQLTARKRAHGLFQW